MIIGGHNRVKKIMWYTIRWFKYYILNPHYEKFYGNFENYCKQRKMYEKKHNIK